MEKRPVLRIELILKSMNNINPQFNDNSTIFEGLRWRWKKFDIQNYELVTGSLFWPKSQNNNFGQKMAGYFFVHCQIFLARPYGGAKIRPITIRPYNISARIDSARNQKNTSPLWISIEQFFMSQKNLFRLLLLTI